jgi:hypothetical protein
MNVVAFGTRPSGTVSDTLLRLHPLACQNWTFLVRSIDSAHSQDDLSNSLSFHTIPYRVLDGNIYLDSEAILKALAAEVFTGFDEVWILSGEVPSGDLTHLPSATSDATDFSKGIPEKLMKALQGIDCVAVLGDGCGLNYATSDERIARELNG